MIFKNKYMSFINKSVNYSETILLKSKLLKPVLAEINKIKKQEKKHNVQETNILIPNNNNKFFLFVTQKNKIMDTQDTSNILYFFSSNNKKEFFIEINFCWSSTLLMEGYLYEDNNYLLTDILYKDNPITVDYLFRYGLLNELTHNLTLTKLNNHLTINIHPIFTTENETIINIFLNNFKFKDSILALETITSYSKLTKLLPSSKQNTQMSIKKTKYADVYNVYDSDFNHVGILYVKGLRESKFLKTIIKSQEYTLLQCSFNTHVNKWQPILTKI